MANPAPAASLWRRLAAACYDLLVLAGVLMLTSMAVVIARGGSPVPAGSRLFQGALALQAAAFFVAFWCHGGQTAGMRAWNIRVMRCDGRPLGAGVAVARLLACLLSTAALGLGFLWILLDPQRLAWHDRLTGTRVVQVPRPGR
jgi:uncharacterized RDD family membrane protein YckC